jgi:hypothetical protein
LVMGISVCANRAARNRSPSNGAWHFYAHTGTLNHYLGLWCNLRVILGQSRVFASQFLHDRRILDARKAFPIISDRL